MLSRHTIPTLFPYTTLFRSGLLGPQVGPMNLAGVLPWIHWRGFLILALLALGNVFCMACPFVLPRTIARRWLPQGRSWPRNRARSEEHTSELQSLAYLVCRL